jgi:hypothetical protein
MMAAKDLVIRIVLSGFSSFLTEPVLARVIACSFTEPFIRTSYDSDHRTLTITYDVENRSEVQRNISLKAITPTILELQNEKKQVVQRLKLSFRGSDGMSDRLYPYAVQWTPMNDELPQVLYGGCE